MPLPAPERGLVISYSYLWEGEYQKGREEGVKQRPCVIVLAVDDSDGDCLVTVLPVTHSAPARAAQAVELPAATKRRLGLDDDRSWVMVTEGNRFVWPGPDLVPIAPERVDYGLLPPALFRQIQDQFFRYFSSRRMPIVPRTDI